MIAPAAAQVKAYKSDKMTAANSVAYALPRTAIKVRVVAQRESIKVGPYARFAQKYLGVIAPLADKQLCTVQRATLQGVREADPAEVYVLENPDKSAASLYEPTPEGLLAVAMEGEMPGGNLHKRPHAKALCGKIQEVSYVRNPTEFLKVQIDKMEAGEKSPEVMAAAAAQQIFSLRKHRMDLITGEAGENVFGEGLKTALKEIDRMEQEYLSLFLGKQTLETVVREFEVVPTKGENTLIICRISDNGGIVDASDLAGRPLTLEMTPEQQTDRSPWVNKKESKDPKGMIYYRIADMVNCRVMDGTREIAQSRLPIYQFGAIVQMPAAALK